MGKSNFRDLIVWQKARQLAVAVYAATGVFPRCELFGLTQQMRRAAVSVACNIAEGHGRRSIKDTLNFLGIARGSLLELETQVVIATDLTFLREEGSTIVEQVIDVLKLLNGLIRHYERQL